MGQLESASEIMKTSVLVISLLGIGLCSSLPNTINPAHTSPTSAVKQTGLTSADQESHANPPIASLPATTQYKGYHTTVRTDKARLKSCSKNVNFLLQNVIPLEEYDEFFHLVDNFL